MMVCFIVVKIIYACLFYARAAVHAHIHIMGGIHLEEHLEDRDYQSKRKECKKGREYIEDYTQGQGFLIRRDKSPQYFYEVAHLFLADITLQRYNKSARVATDYFLRITTLCSS